MKDSIEQIIEKIEITSNTIRSINNDIQIRTAELSDGTRTLEELTRRLGNLSISQSRPNLARGNDLKDIRPGDRVIITNKNSNRLEKHAIVTGVQYDPVYTKRILLTYETTGRNSWKALNNVSRVLQK